MLFISYTHTVTSCSSQQEHETIVQNSCTTFPSYTNSYFLYCISYWARNDVFHIYVSLQFSLSSKSHNHTLVNYGYRTQISCQLQFMLVHEQGLYLSIFLLGSTLIQSTLKFDF